jgi:DNA phosphorothioation-dependent restriction protein DptG
MAILPCAKVVLLFIGSNWTEFCERIFASFAHHLLRHFLKRCLARISHAQWLAVTGEQKLLVTRVKIRNRSASVIAKGDY